jgi:hypothetical protein
MKRDKLDKTENQNKGLAIDSGSKTLSDSEDCSGQILGVQR